MQPDYSLIIREVVSALPFFVGILAFVFALGVLEKLVGRRGRRARWQGRRGSVAPFAPKHDRFRSRWQDAADQLRTVMQAEFKAQRLLNKSEARLFRAIDKLVIELAPPGWQVMAQVSLGEILSSKDDEAYACINSKRVDLLIVDEECRPLDAIEYQGGGHHQGTAAARDAVKKEALRRAGVGYVEVVGGRWGRQSCGRWWRSSCVALGSSQKPKGLSCRLTSR